MSVFINMLPGAAAATLVFMLVVYQPTDTKATITLEPVKVAAIHKVDWSNPADPPKVPSKVVQDPLKPPSKPAPVRIKVPQPEPPRKIDTPVKVPEPQVELAADGCPKGTHWRSSEGGIPLECVLEGH